MRGERPVTGPPFAFVGMRELRLHLEIVLPTMKVFVSAMGAEARHAANARLCWVTGDTFLAAANAVKDFMRLRGLDTSYEKVYGALSCVIHTEYAETKSEVVDATP